MNVDTFDLNLLVCFDVLMRERNVSRAAEKLNISQPAMSNSLKRLRHHFGDPLLVRTTQGMEPTEKALELEPLVRQSLGAAEEALSPKESFDPANSQRVFRILVSDYVEGTLISSLVAYLQSHAPGLSLDILTLSDGSFQDLEKGAIDLAINRFDSIPQSFYKRTIWQDSFSCLLTEGHSLIDSNTLENYLDASHIWVSKTGIGVGTGMSQSSDRGWVDNALTDLGYERQISVFTRHYQIIPLLVQQTNLVATMPTRAALAYKDHPGLAIIDPPFTINPIEINMVWSPILHHNSAHQWIRQTLVELAEKILLNSSGSR
ncbi:MAG: LysR family transcriptional regulator [Cellvibrionaceae bacterium]